MSEKKAKELRRQVAADTPVATIQLIYTAGGKILIQGVPVNQDLAMQMIAAGLKWTVDFFANRNRQENEGKIQQVKTPILGLDGRSLN